MSYGMSHLLKSCLMSSVQLCRPEPLVCMCVCVRACTRVCVDPFSQSTAVSLLLNGKDRCFKDDNVFTWNLNVYQTSDSLSCLCVIYRAGVETCFT